MKGQYIDEIKESWLLDLDFAILILMRNFKLSSDTSFRKLILWISQFSNKNFVYFSTGKELKNSTNP